MPRKPPCVGYLHLFLLGIEASSGSGKLCFPVAQSPSLARRLTSIMWHFWALGMIINTRAVKKAPFSPFIWECVHSHPPVTSEVNTWVYMPPWL